MPTRVKPQRRAPPNLLSLALLALLLFSQVMCTAVESRDPQASRARTSCFPLPVPCRFAKAISSRTSMASDGLLALTGSPDSCEAGSIALKLSGVSATRGAVVAGAAP